MTAAAAVLAPDYQALALELHALLRDMDPARWRDELEGAIRLRLQELEARLETLRERPSPDLQLAQVRERLDELSEMLRSFAPAEAPSMPDLRAEWMELRTRLQPAYEELALSLRPFDVHVPSLRPTNYRRNMLHVFSGVFGLVCIEEWMSAAALIGIAGSVTVWAWTMEIGRRRSTWLNDKLMAALGAVAHPHEWHRINSATWYSTAMLMLALTETTLLCALAVIVLGLADPAAALVGRRWGRTKLVNGRSLEGSTAFFVVAALASWATISIWHPEVQGTALPIMVGVAAVSGTLAELFCRRVDDNFAIPVSIAASIWTTASVLGVVLH